MGSSGVGERGPIDLAVLQQNGARALGREGVAVAGEVCVIYQGKACCVTGEVCSAKTRWEIAIVVCVPFNATVIASHADEVHVGCSIVEGNGWNSR